MDTEAKDQCGTQVCSPGEDRDGAPGLPADAVKAYAHSCSLGPLLQRLVGKLGQCHSPLTG